jgi:hypothetical protein
MSLRFTIRDLLWLTVVVALIVGWWFDRNRLIAAQGGYKIHTEADGHVMLQGSAWGEIWRKEKDGHEWKQQFGGFGNGISK